MVRRLVLGPLSRLSKPREVDLSAHSSAVVMSLPDAASSPRVVAFLNRCPHVGTPLNMSDGFMDRTQQFLLCETHGALFQPTDGLCVQGPCVGKHLTPIPVLVEAAPASADRDDPLVVLLVDEQALAPKTTCLKSKASGAVRAGAETSLTMPMMRGAASADDAVPVRSAIDDEFDSILRSLDARRPTR